MVDFFSLVSCLQLPTRHLLVVMESREPCLANVAVYLLLTKEWSITLALRSIMTDPGVPWFLFMNENGAVVVSFDEVIPYVVHRVLKSPYSMFDCNSDSKFNDTCKPEECSSGQPKYCLKKINARCYQLCSSLWTFFKPNISPHVLKGESKTFLDSGFHGVDSGFQVLDPDTLSVELRFQLIAGFRIP